MSQRLRDKGIECFCRPSRRKSRRRRSGRGVDGDQEDAIPELEAAREKLLPIVRRAEMLAELMRFRQAVAIGGTHGKTTTTSMVATLLDAGGLDPTVINGGIINAYGTNARMGGGEWMVVEADESDGTFLKLPADIAVGHQYRSRTSRPLRQLRQGARSFPPVRRERAVLRLWRDVHGSSRKCRRWSAASRTGASSPMARMRRPMCASPATAWRTRPSKFDVVDPQPQERRPDDDIDELRLPMPGRHNVSNATAAIAVAHELGFPPTAIKQGLSSLRRRQAPLHAIPARGTASRCSTITAIIRSRSRRC